MQTFLLLYAEGRFHAAVNYAGTGPHSNNDFEETPAPSAYEVHDINYVVYCNMHVNYHNQSLVSGSPYA